MVPATARGLAPIIYSKKNFSEPSEHLGNLRHIRTGFVLRLMGGRMRSLMMIS